MKINKNRCNGNEHETLWLLLFAFVKVFKKKKKTSFLEKVARIRASETDSKCPLGSRHGEESQAVQTSRSCCEGSSGGGGAPEGAGLPDAAFLCASLSAL